MRKLIIGLALAAGCRSGSTMSATPPTPHSAKGGSNATGAPNGRDAVVQFLAAVKAQDLQALGGIWGGPDGPARDNWSMDELQKRELVMLCYLKFDSYEIVGDAPTTKGDRTYSVNMKLKDLSHTGLFTVTRAGSGRYYMQSVDNFQLFQDFCGAK